MRAILPVTLLLSTLLVACASKGDKPPNKQIPQNEVLKVHPGLLGKPVPAELQPEPRPEPQMQPQPVPTVPPTSDTTMKLDPVGLRTQRSVYFDYNSASLKADYKPALRAHGRYLADNPTARVRVEGNADERGSTEHNQKLGLKRAETVRLALLSGGAAEKQLHIKSLGETRPKLTGHDEESWAENRRADVVYEREQ